MPCSLKIVFMGTPEFAVNSLDILVKGGYEVVGVITAPDKPSGRGRSMKQSAIKDYALLKGLKILQPTNLKDVEFQKELKYLNANLQVVVAFRMLPESVWSMPELGTFNLHASLLPNYRGAAPINWAIINGEQETGLTTFFLKQDIDTGDVVFQEKVMIPDDITAGQLHDQLKILGGKLVLKTVESIESCDYQLSAQSELVLANTKLNPAPKIFKKDCQINWKNNVVKIYNQIRGLSPYPGAWTTLTNPENESFNFKIYKVGKIEANGISYTGGSIQVEDKAISIKCKGGLIILKEVQIAGKKKMHIDEFLRGMQIDSNWTIT